MKGHQVTHALRDNRLLRTEEEISAYEQAVSSVADLDEVHYIRGLYAGFHDDTGNDEVMFGLVHAIESLDQSFGTEPVLAQLAESLPDLLPHAKEWAVTLHKRILNHAPSRKAYANVLSTVDGVNRSIALQLVHEIKERNPEVFGASADGFFSGVKG